MKKNLARLLSVLKHMSVTYNPLPEVKFTEQVNKEKNTWFLYSFSDFSGWEKPLKVAISKG